MLKNYNYMLTILLYPFMLVIIYLNLTNYIKGEIYTYLIIIMIIVFIPSFIMSLYSASEEILSSKKKWRMIFLILLSIFYLPIYYTKYVSKEEKYLGFILLIISIPLTYITTDICGKKLLTFFNRAYENYSKIVIDYNHIASNNLFYVRVDESFRCNSEDIGEYVFYCERLEDDSFIGIYSYDITYDEDEDIEEKLDFHVNQTLDYIKEKEYSYEINDETDIIQIDYNDNTVLISQRNYFLDEEHRYSLIILKEVPRELLNYEEYQKMIDSITFLNYNEEVSS